MRTILVVIAAALIAYATASVEEKKVVCYFSSWSVYRTGNGHIDFEDIDQNLCTHLNYAFIGISLLGEPVILDSWLALPKPAGGLDGFNRFNRLRQRHPNLKTLVSIGGWNEDPLTFSHVAADPKLRRAFAENTAVFCKKFGFNGLDIVWQYPNQRGGVPADVLNFELLLKEVRQRFDQDGLLLTAAVAASEVSASQSYASNVATYVDFLNVMAYDYHGIWEHKTGHNAPLYSGSWETINERHLNVAASVWYWLAKGVPANKIVLGIPFYGKSYTLSSQNVKVGAPISGVGNPGPYTREAGTLGFNEICEMQMNNNRVNYFDLEQRVPYTVQGNQWVGYEDLGSVAEKAVFTNIKELGGIMVWSIDTDDFRNVCGYGKYPLLRRLNKFLRPNETSH